MAIRKAVEESVVVRGEREEWLRRCQEALVSEGFKRIQTSETLYQVRGDYKKWLGTLWGEIQVTLLPEGGGQTRLDMRAWANVDNLYALFRSPGRKIIEVFKQGLE